MAKSLVIKHWVACPPQRVWDAWTNPEEFHRFIAPEGLSVPRESVMMELRVGGRVEFDMVFDDSGEVNENKGVIVEMQEPNLFVFSEPGIDIRSEQHFIEDNGGTLIMVVQDGFPDEIVDDPRVLEAFRSSYRKLGNVLGVRTENREA